MRIGILEDEPVLASHLASTLTLPGSTCFVFHSGKHLINLLHHETFDVLVLDWNVPDMSGLAVVEWVRENLPKPPPTLMLTNRSLEEDIVTALKAGADDYVIKPVQPAVLRARIEALCRRAYPDQRVPSIEKFGKYQFDTRFGTVLIGDEPVSLTSKEFALALMLFRNLNRALSRSYMLESIWGLNPETQTRTLDQHISKVRTKLRLRPQSGLRLVPVYAYGYRLEADNLDGHEE
jgi:DNA-binding response OmpR family regulator